MRGWGIVCGVVGCLLTIVLAGVIDTMPHGYPPWSGISKQTVFSLPIDMGELAVRLGSPVAFDRRGDVIWYTDFEHGRRAMGTEVSGTGADVSISAITAFTGAYSVKLTNGSDNSRFASIRKELYPTTVSKVGFEFSWASVYNDQYVEAWVEYLDGATIYRFIIRYDEALDVLQYRDSAGDLQNIATDLKMAVSSTVFHTLKLVIDLDTLEYVRVLVDGTTYLLTGYKGTQAAWITDPMIKCCVYNNGEAGENHYIWVDNVIITQNEP
jgi:hypothetical protein